uniref:amiloride-sensitive sodium channel subunit gamma-like n=1 Tax=Pristiophorus japonicus TaxID=55135 RepID=UPI00398F19C6
MESGTKRLREKIREKLPVTGPQAASAYELVRWYCYHTNTHGCRRIVVSRGRLRRAAWVLLTFGAVGIIFWQCALLIASYYTASVTITVHFQEITFPAVTICNKNPYRYNATRHLFEKLDQATQIAIKELYHITNSPNSSQAQAQSEAIAEGQDDGLFWNIPLLRIDLMDREYSIVSDLITKRRHRVNGMVKTQSFSSVDTHNRAKLVGFKLCDKTDDKNSTCVIYTFNSGITAIQEWYRLHYLNIMAQVPQQTKLQMGYSTDDLVFSCLFDELPCDSRNFSRMHHPLHGNCFTFNGGENGSVLRTRTGGSDNGLKVTLHLDGNEYNPYLVTSMGAKIVIHDQNEQPFIEDGGIEIQTATETALGIDMTVSQKLSSPYSDCTADGRDVPVTNLYNKTYSLQMCLHSCFQMEMVRSCGCAHYEKPLPAEAEYCDGIKYPGWVSCYYQLRDRFIQEQLVCQKICRPACHSKEWTMTISVAQWPSSPSEEWILRLLSWEKGFHGNRTLRKNELANLAIFYKDLNMRNISETAANNVVTLLSNFGGQLGLWMSCSVVCIIEIVEVFFIDMFLIAARRGRQAARKWWRKEQEPPVLRSAVNATPFYISDEDPPTFNSALKLPRPPVNDPTFPTLPNRMACVKVQQYFSRALHRLQKGPGYTCTGLLVWYCENTNTHGPKRIVTEGPKKRIVWFALTLVFTSLVCWQWGILIRSYLAWEVSVNLHTGFRAMEFPAVTVCNTNPFRYTRSKQLLQPLDRFARLALERIYIYHQNGTIPSDLPSSQTNWSKVASLVIIEESDQGEETVLHVLGSTPSQSHSATRNRSRGRGYKVALQLCNEDSSGCISRNFSTVLETMSEWYSLHYMSILSNVPPADRLAMGEQGEDFILTCLFSGQPCNLENFTQLMHPTYGNCYIFNWGSDGQALVTANPGAEFGLKVVLDISQEDYNPFLSIAAGARLMLHQQNTYPFLQDLGLYARAGTETSIGIFVDEIVRLGRSYSHCTFDGSDVDVKTLYNTTYTMQTCLRSCLQDHMVKYCGCGYHNDLLPEGAHYCNNKDHPNWGYCYYHLKEQIESENSDCLESCKQPCNETQYRLTISMADWPSESSEDWIYHVLSYERDSASSVTVNRSSILKLNLYFQEINYRMIQEEPALTIDWLPSKLGGQFGFWMGGSILCIIELTEIIIDCLWITVIKVVRWFSERRSRRARGQRPDPLPTVAQSTEGHTNPGFQPEPTEARAERPCALAIPGTPPPQYDSLRIHPINHGAKTWDCGQS